MTRFFLNKFLLAGTAAMLAVLLLMPMSSRAQDKTPLLQEGKKTLFQRVVSHPGAVLRATPAADAAAVNDKVKPFTVFYVYDRQGDWLEVGVASNASLGWVEASSITDWPQAMTLLFTERTGRSPVLFFKDEKSLTEVGTSDNLPEKLQTLLAQVKAAKEGKDVGDLPVVAAEPEDEQGAVSRKRFYLMPIQAMEEPFEGTKFLRVASVDPGSAGAGKSKAGGGASAEGGDGQGGKDGEKPESMSTAIAFVIDTTISMKPYIDQSLNVVRAAFDSIEKDKLDDNVAFGMVAFRNNTTARPGLKYLTEVVSDFRTAKDRKELEAALSKVEEATASSHSFDEDAMAGVKAAVDSLSWDKYQSRILVLITDAGPLAGGDKYASTQMATSEMMDYAKSKNIWLTVMHVRSPNGKKNHAYAEKAYRQLTRLPDNSSSYMPIPAPTPKQGGEAFAAATKVMAESLTKVVKSTSERKMAPKPQPPAQAPTPEDEARRVADTIGYAMQLEFLGQQRGNQAPGVVSAWIADMDLAMLAQDKYSPAVEVAVLLTKNQLSDLQKQLKIIIDEAERTKKTDSKDFFQGILSASAQMARDPGKFSQKPGQNLAQLGVLSEFLDGLPYKSDIMLLQEEDWYRMSVGEQTSFINRLRSRIARYEEYDKDRSNWESFGAPNAGDWVYRVPLSMLP